MNSQQPMIVSVSGFSSSVGKTTLACELLRHLPGWEAIKMTRGHYRSCGKDPVACCVSELISDEPVIRSGREANCEFGKDTGRFWQAGAANVHWVIVTDDQVEKGINEALKRVKSEGVVVEGNSFLKYVKSDVAVMCARADGGKVKASARRAMRETDFLYLSSLDTDGVIARQQFAQWRAALAGVPDLGDLPILTHEDIPRLLMVINQNKKLADSARSVTYS